MAIAFDAATTPVNNSNSTSLTFSHTCTGSNRALFVATGLHTSDVVTGVTYGGVAMTLMGKVTNGRWVYIYGLLNPASGANDVVVTCSSAADFLGATAMSYTGVLQSGLPDAVNTFTGNSTTITTSLTSVADNCWFLVAGRMGPNATASTNTTYRGNMNDTWEVVGDSNGPKTPAGSFSMTSTSSSANPWNVVMLSVAPAPPASTHKFFQMVEKA